MYHIYNEAGVKQHVDKLLKQDPKTWEPSGSNEIGRLTKGIRDIQGNDVFDFIAKHEVPPYKKVTYANLVCDYRPSKDDPYRTRLTVGGDRLDYFGDSASPAASLLEIKLLLNSTISDAKYWARFMTLDIKDYFLQSILPDPEFIRIHKNIFSKTSETNTTLNQS